MRFSFIHSFCLVLYGSIFSRASKPDGMGCGHRVRCWLLIFEGVMQNTESPDFRFSEVGVFLIACE